MRPVFEQPAVLEDLRRFTVALEPKVTLGAAARLPTFERPVLLAWATDDKLFPLQHAERLASLLPNARVERIDGSRAFSMIDRPARLTDLVAAFAGVELAHTD